ncbi:MAG: hypothetical protein ACRDTA_23040 [Pseudonocardiaceae bacterium]
MPAPDIHADLIQRAVDEHTRLVHRTLRIVDEGALHLSPLVTQTSGIVQQTHPFHSTVTSGVDGHRRRRMSRRLLGVTRCAGMRSERLSFCGLSFCGLSFWDIAGARRIRVARITGLHTHSILAVEDATYPFTL